MVAALLIALALLIAAPPAAEATFPGRNGDLLVTEDGNSHFDQDADLLMVDPRSGQVTRVDICTQNGTPPPANCFYAGPPAVSPDGGSIAFVTSDLDSKTRIRVLTLGSGAWTQINLAESIRVSGKSIVRWSPGPSFLLTQHPTGLIRALWNGSDDGELRSWGSDPDVSVGGLVVYVRHGNLQVVEPGEGGGTRRLTRRGATQPSWSPHQRQIAFTRKGWIYTVPLLGAPPNRLARGFQPTWSPDGKQIAFFRTDPDRKYFGDDATYLYVLNRRTGKVRRASSQVMALEDAYANATDGLDWQPAR